MKPFGYFTMTVCGLIISASFACSIIILLLRISLVIMLAALVMICELESVHSFDFQKKIFSSSRQIKKQHEHGEWCTTLLPLIAVVSIKLHIIN
jgi:hypothetical protein